MADRFTNDSSFGQPGRLIYNGYQGEPQGEEYGWHSSRNHDPDAPKLHEIVGPEEWFPASKPTQTANSPGNKWKPARKQRKWLSKRYPEAALGCEVLEDLLIEDIANELDVSEESHCVQLAVGEIADRSRARMTRSAPLLAMAAGTGGEVLRLVRPSIEEWHLESNQGPTIRSLGHVHHHETLWAKETGPIRRIKAVVHAKRFEPLRLLIVQRDLVTTVLQPVFQRMPYVSEFPRGKGYHEPSHVAPNPLCTISTKQTGFHFHSDAAFQPGIKSQPPQLAIVDEGGRWSIWTVKGIRNAGHARPIVELKLRGDMERGILKDMNDEPTPDPTWYMIDWVGSSGDMEVDPEDHDEEDHVAQTQSTFSARQRSSILLLCNRKRLRLLNLDTGVFLPDLRFIPEDSDESILDIVVDTQNARFLYVLTTLFIYIVGIDTTKDVAGFTMEAKAAILHSALHFGDRYNASLRLTLAPGIWSATNWNIVLLVYSKHSQWVSVLHVQAPKKASERIICNHDALHLEIPPRSNYSTAIQTLCSSLTTFAPPDGGQHRLFYQIFALGTDLGLSSSLVLVSSPTGRLDTPLIKETPGEDPMMGQRRRAVHHLETRFMVPDDLAEFRYLDVELWDTDSAEHSQQDRKTPRRLIRRVLDVILDAFPRMPMGGDKGSTELDMTGAAPFDPLYLTVERALETRSMPRQTLHSIISNLTPLEDIEEASDEWSSEIALLRNRFPALPIVDIPSLNQTTFPKESTLLELYTALIHCFTETATERPFSGPRMHVASYVSSEMACDLFLSSLCIMYQEGPFFSPPPPPPQLAQGNFPVSSFQPSIPASKPVTQQPSTRQPATQPSDTPAPEEPEPSDQAIALIRAHTGTGRAEPKEKGTAWSAIEPWTLGQSPDDYVFSIDRNAEITPGVRRRARMEAHEARKRKRAESFQRLREQQQQEQRATMSQPGPETRSFGDNSSQSQGQSQGFWQWPGPGGQTVRGELPEGRSGVKITMSQPVAGAFGKRGGVGPPRKKVKRKGGF